MNHAKLLMMLSEKMTETGNGTLIRTIIRFRTPGHYQECMCQLQEMRRAGEPLSAIRPIETISAMVCSLHSAEQLDMFKDDLIVEEDTPIKLHVKGFIPLPPGFNQHAPITFDAKNRIPWGVKQIKAPLVWNKTMGNRVKIGVVDTGADFNHPDLKSSLAGGVNLLNRFSLPIDDNGHGTHIAGTIAAYNQHYGMTGVAPKAAIYPIKAFDRYGSAYVSDIIMGIDWCVANQMDIINMSFGMKQRSQSLLDAVTAAYKSGVVIVSSSGNDGRRAFVDYPARFPQTIAVGATNKRNQITSFTNRGKQIDVYAPGADIFSTWVGGKYNELSGTSMATSHVTGLIALMKSYNPGLSPKRIKHVLRLSSIFVKTPSNKPASKGMIQAIRTMRLVQKLYGKRRHSARKSRKV